MSINIRMNPAPIPSTAVKHQSKMLAMRVRLYAANVSLVCARASAIDGTMFFLRHVRRHSTLAQLLDEFGRVVTLVGAQCRAGFLNAAPAMMKAASRSTVPFARMVMVSTTRPLGFFISACPR